MRPSTQSIHARTRHCVRFLVKLAKIIGLLKGWSFWGGIGGKVYYWRLGEGACVSARADFIYIITRHKDAFCACADGWKFECTPHNAAHEILVCGCDKSMKMSNLWFSRRKLAYEILRIYSCVYIFKFTTKIYKSIVEVIDLQIYIFNSVTIFLLFHFINYSRISAIKWSDCLINIITLN